MLDTARYLGGSLDAIRARLSTKADTYCWFLEVAYANGCLGQLDLTIAVRMGYGTTSLPMSGWHICG